MLHFSIIGYLAADAEVKSFSSGDWTCFRVAHNFKDADGKDKTQWVSCMLRGSGGKLLEFLKKGTLVFVCGRGSARAFSSQITKQFEIGLDIQVDRLELIGTKQKITLEAVLQAIERSELSVNELKEKINDLPF